MFIRCAPEAFFKKEKRKKRAPSLGSAFVRCGVERTQRRQRRRPRALWFANVAVSILFAKKKRKSLLLTKREIIEVIPRSHSWRSTGRRRRAPSTCRCSTCTRSLRTPQPAIRHFTGSHLMLVSFFLETQNAICILKITLISGQK